MQQHAIEVWEVAESEWERIHWLIKQLSLKCSQEQQGVKDESGTCTIEVALFGRKIFARTEEIA